MAELHVLTFPVPDPGGDNKQLFLFESPTDAHGGGLTIVAASAVNGAATGSGTSFTYALHKYSNAGTPAVNGTIAAAIGSTSDPWADAVPKDFTITAAYAWVDAGEWVVLDYQEETAGNPTNSFVNIHYVQGRV